VVICKQLGGQWLIRSVDATREYSVDLSSFPFVSAIRLDPTGTRLAVTAVPRGKRLPSLSENIAGDVALFVCDLHQNRWSEIHEDYAHDPAWFPDSSRLAFHTGNGIASISESGADFREHFRLGKFNWGPPCFRQPGRLEGRLHQVEG
jgi:hypothetical protein